MAETILLVDDDAVLLRLLARTLTSGGYRVLEAENATDALAVFATHQDVIHLVVTDLGMPGWRGPELIDMLRLMSPALKVLFISGSAADPSFPNEPHLRKPFARADLLAVVQQLLSEPPLQSR
jgi:two-component system, cell cycle sensor histidine kinase and response regulator CckA